MRNFTKEMGNLDLKSLPKNILYFLQCLIGLDTETTDKDFPESRPTNISIQPYLGDLKSSLNLDLFIRLSFGYFISPYALIIQNRFYSEINSKNNYDFYDAMKILMSFINSHSRGKIITGHNLVKFDLKQINIWLNKCLYPPYPFQPRFGNTIIDTLDVAKFLKAFNSRDFKFENLKLETLMKFFVGDTYTQLHGAAADVKDVFLLLEMFKKELSTIDLFEILQWFCKLDNRKNFFNNSLLLRPNWHGKFIPIIPVADCKSWNNYKIILPFNDEEINWDVKNPILIASQIKKFSKPDSMPIKYEILYPYYLKNKISEAGKKALPNLAVSHDFFTDVVNNLRNDQNFIQEAQIIVNEKRKTSKNAGRKYEGHYFDGAGFFDEDSHLMKFFHKALPAKKKEICQSFQNDGIRKNAEMYILNKHPEVLSKTELEEKLDKIHYDFLDENNLSRVTYTSCQKDFMKIEEEVRDGKRILSSRQRDILDDYKVRLEAFKANPKRFWEQRHGY